MKELLQDLAVAKNAYEMNLNTLAEKATESFREAAEYLSNLGVKGGYSEIRDEDFGDYVLSSGICWDGAKFGYYFSEDVDSDTPYHHLPNILGEKRERRIEGVRLLPKLLERIKADYEKRAQELI